MRSALLIIAVLLLSVAGRCQVPQLISDIATGDSSSRFGQYIVYGHKLLFELYPGQLWITDGTAGGTQLVKTFPDYSEPKSFVICNNKVYFIGVDSLYGQELWVTDGTTPGTQMVKDIRPGPFSALYGNIAVMNNKLYFAANDSLHGSELWVSDGTAAGTQMVKDVNPAPGISGAGDYVAAVPGKVIFAGNNGTMGEEPWVSDGTATGTQLLANLDAILGDTSLINNFYAFDNKVYFSERMSISLNHPPQAKFCVTDGSLGGTFILNNNLENIGGIAEMNGKVYFNAASYNASFIGHNALWMTDGTAGGTQMLKDSITGRGFTAFNNKLYFGSEGTQTYAVYTNQLWVSDGTTTGTVALKDLSAPIPVNDCKLPGDLAVAHNTLFFKAWDSATGRINLWASDGTANGMHYVNYPNATAANFNLCSEIPSLIAVVDSNIFFSMEYDTTNTGFELYKVPVTVAVPGLTRADAQLRIYPNPAADHIVIECSLDDEAVISAELADITGKIVEQLKPAGASSGSNYKGIYPVSKLPDGIYLLKLITTGEVLCRKFVVQH